MDVFAREHDPRTAAKTLSDALTVRLRAVESAAMNAAAGSELIYAGIDLTGYTAVLRFLDQYLSR
jgi:hypothetical protein